MLFLLSKRSETSKNAILQIHILHKASKFIWITFHRFCPTKEDFEDYNVPFDCQFVIVCQKNSTSFLVLEIFKLENMTSVIDFGKWNANFGLMISKTFFYHRRMNLNGTIFNLINAFPEFVSN